MSDPLVTGRMTTVEVLDILSGSELGMSASHVTDVTTATEPGKAPEQALEAADEQLTSNGSLDGCSRHAGDGVGSNSFYNPLESFTAQTDDSNSPLTEDWKECVEESELEFDDVCTDIGSTSVLAKEDLEKPYHCGAITPEGFIDDDFEEELGSPTRADDKDPDLAFREIAKYGIIQVAGDDAYGRKVIVFSACRLPPKEEIDHQKLLVYLKHTLDQYVENDYTLVYFHFGLMSRNKPSFSWLLQAYGEFDRKYKKNLKALYLVHPTGFIKFMWKLFSPLISVKFGRKVTYANYLHELAQHIQLDQLIIPQRVRDYDVYLLAKNKPQPVPSSITHPPLPTQQFGVDLSFIKQNNGGNIVPPIICQCVTHLRMHGLETEGLFRRSASASTLKQVQKTFNEGATVDFTQLNNVHIPAAILKSFLRQLPEPLLTYELYDHVIHVQSLEEDERLREMRRILTEELFDDNYFILKYIIQFLTEVVEKSDTNKMTAENLSVIFGPNLLWSRNKASLASLGYVNNCALLLITNYDDLFVK